MTESIKTEITRLEQERCRAVMARDFTALTALVDDDLVHIHASGRAETKAEYLRGVEQSFVFTNVARPELTVRAYGDVAVATGRLTQNVKIVATNEERAMNLATTQVWRKRDGSWRQVSFQATAA